MKNLMIIVVGLLCSTLFSSCDWFNGGGNTNNSGNNTAPSSNCIYAKNIVAHYCKPRVSTFVSPDPIHRSDIVLAIEEAGTIPTGNCPNQGQHTDWDAFDIRTEVIGSNGAIVPNTTQNRSNLLVSTLSPATALANGTAVRYYSLPSNMVVLPNTNTNTIPNQSYTLRVTIWGRNAGVRSSHPTIYTLNVTSNIGQKCKSVMQPPNKN